eukprot:CAMPEP_0194210058 /NCGR_PEP_ID=MMETSP0156-20130528/7974_1 /TAXON_ID=33649 /ORGANISM="Thalassionema nitzschioides, Strain L26-B" /LENGTH=333 /DNA_ID=CAMNT_0038937343 /DNA_START=109 /DNA_END=1110 /DNA_ORIENTATION=+
MSVCFLTRTENSPVRADDWCNNLDMGSSNMTDNNRKNIIDPFEAWVKMRTGVRLDSSREDEGIAELGTSPIVFWAGYGELRESYSGKVIAKFEGFDVAKGVRLDNDTVRQLSRKIFWWRDAKTGKLLTNYKGSQVDPIRYDYQTFDYSRYPSNNETNIISNGCGVAAYPTVVNGIRDVFADPITFQMIGESCLFQASVFIDVELPDEAGSGRYQAWEYYDYNLDPSYRDNRPPTAVWCRNGFVPPFAEETRVVLDNGVQRKQQPGVMRFVGRRYDKYDQLPQSMRELVEQSKSKEGIIEPAPGWDLFRAPPVDMEEIESLTSKEIKKRKQSKA